MESFAIPDLPVISGGAVAGLEAAFVEHLPIVDRLWGRDHRLWREDPTEIADRLGWLDAPELQTDRIGEYEALRTAAIEDGLTDVVVIGMGGSSLFPDVLARTFPVGGLRIHVLDSTHPAAVQRALDLPASTTLFSVASKSGTTLETRSHLEAAWATRVDAVPVPGSRFVAITDPGSQLAALSVERGFRATVLAPPDVGGRFSAMTPFGLVPAALLGVDVRRLLESASGEVALCRVADAALNPGYRLGVFLAEAVRAGRDKVTLWFSGDAAPFADWVEQLVAESLGKDGVSVVPIAGEAAPVSTPRQVDGTDRVHVMLGDPGVFEAFADKDAPVLFQPWGGPYDLGSQVFRWEFATAVAGAILGVQPFDQPDVASAKTATATVLEAGPGEIALTPLADALEDVRPGDVLAVTAFVDPRGYLAKSLSRVQVALRRRAGVAVTVGIGPRYLHSTGQLHKGGSDRIVVLQVVDDLAGEDVAIPGQDFGFATLLAAQAEGDLGALRERGRRVHRVAASELLAI